MRTHVGKVLKEVAYDRRMRVRDVARALGISNQAVYLMMRRSVIEFKWVPVLCKVLDHDFYQYYLPKGYGVQKSNVSELKLRIEELETEVARLKQEIVDVRELNELLREKRA